MLPSLEHDSDSESDSPTNPPQLPQQSITTSLASMIKAKNPFSSTAKKSDKVKWTSLPNDGNDSDYATDLHLDMMDSDFDDSGLKEGNEMREFCSPQRVNTNTSAIGSDEDDEDGNDSGFDDIHAVSQFPRKTPATFPLFLKITLALLFFTIFTAGFLYLFSDRLREFSTPNSPTSPPEDVPKSTAPDPNLHNEINANTPQYPPHYNDTTRFTSPIFQSYDVIRQRAELELQNYSKFTRPPRLLPPLNDTTRLNLLTTPIVDFDINTKSSLLTNTFFPIPPKIQTQMGKFDILSAHSPISPQHPNTNIHAENPFNQTQFILDQSHNRQFENDFPNTFDDIVNREVEHHTRLQNALHTAKPLSTSETFDTTVNFITWSEYLEIVKKNETQYRALLPPERQRYQTKVFQAQYATHISLDTTPPTIKFQPDFYRNESTIYSQRPVPERSPPRRIQNPLNQINTTNPFPEYLTYSTTAQKQSAIRREIAHAFGGYYSFVFGSDEFFPVSIQGAYNWGIGLTVIDSLDTLILAQNEEFVHESLNFIANQLKFSTRLNGSLFETVIRGLGGLLSAYSMRPEHTVLLERAVELGDFLLSAFDPNTGLWSGNVRFGAPQGRVSSAVMAEIGTVQIEMETLSRYCGDIKYALAARKSIATIYRLRPNLLFPSISVLQQNPIMNGDIITLGARVDSTYEYFLKLWVLHGKPPYKLELRPHLDDKQGNGHTPDNRRGITWMGNTFSPTDQDSLWFKFRGLYDPSDGVYLPLFLYYQFVLHIPSIFVNSNRDEFLAPIILRGTTMAPNHDHLNCFLGGIFAYGVAHGAYNDKETMSDLYQADCVMKQTGIPCDFLTSTVNRDTSANKKLYHFLVEEMNGFEENPEQPPSQVENGTNPPLFNPESPPEQSDDTNPRQFNPTTDPNQKNPPRFNPITDTEDITTYVKRMHSQFAADLAYTCVATYTTTHTQLSPEVSMITLHDDLRRVYQNIQDPTPKSPRSQPPIIQDLYTHFRYANTLTDPEAIQNALTIPTSISKSPQSFTERTIASKNQVSVPGAHWVETFHYTDKAATTTPPTTPRPIPPVIIKAVPGNTPTPPSSGPFGSPDKETNLIRPETVESLFVLWRTTKNEFYRESIWAIFLQFVYYSRIWSGGYTSVTNVLVSGYTDETWLALNHSSTNSHFSTVKSDDQEEQIILMPRKKTNNNNNSSNGMDTNSTSFSWREYHQVNIPYTELMTSYESLPQKDRQPASGGAYGYGSGPRPSESTKLVINGMNATPVNWNNWFNKLESFALAETFKYILLAFADDDIISLDQWVFNTEAHPVRILY